MGKVINYDAIEAARLTDTGENNDLNYLKSNGPRALPTSPTANNWSAEAIKKQLYKQPEIIFAWVKALGDAVYQFASDVDDVFDDIEADEIVHRTGAETISGKKTFSGGAEFTQKADFTAAAEFSGGAIFNTTNVSFGSGGSDNAQTLHVYYTTLLHGPVVSNIIVPGNPGFSIGTSDTRWHTGYFVNLNLSGKFVKGTYEYELPEKSGTVALTSDLTTKADLVDGKVPADQLPSYVDDVLEYTNYSSFPVTGETGKIYVDKYTGYTYRWGGSGYVQVGGQDLSNYYTKSQTDSAIDADVAVLSGQVADGTVVAGKASKDASGNVITSTYATKTEAAALDSKISKNAEDIATLTEALIKKDLYETQEATFQGMTAVPAGAMVKAYLDGFKGNSAVVNQLAWNGNFDSSANWLVSQYSPNVSMTIAGNKMTATCDVDQTNDWLNVMEYLSDIVVGHRYLISYFKSANKIRTGGSAGIIGATTISYTDNTAANKREHLYTLVEVNSVSDSQLQLFPFAKTSQAAGDSAVFDTVALVDLTINGITSTDIPTIVSLLKHKNMDLDVFIPRNKGTLTDSKPTKLISRGYNLFDGIWLESLDTFSNVIASGPIKVTGGISYTIQAKGWTSTLTQLIVRQYDKSNNEIKSNYYYGDSSPLSVSVTLESATDHIKFGLQKTGIVSEKANCEACFHLASVDLGYKPHVPPIEYDLTMPALKSAGSVQDESKAGGKKVGKDTMADLPWEYTTYGGKSYFVAHVVGKDYGSPVLSDAPYEYSGNGAVNDFVDGHMYTSGYGDQIYIYDTSISTVAALKTKLGSSSVNYQLATPTDFSSTISYPEIFNVEEGGSVEVVGEGCDATTKVYFYVEA